MFQYISCYSLSASGRKLLDIIIRFQYISCYSLSSIGKGNCGNGNVSIHLMLLFINVCRNSRRKCKNVSIHLMLLFIVNMWFMTRRNRRFQYISCYSLSSNEAGIKLVFLWFQYISCYSLSYHALFSIQNLQ